MNNTLKEKFHVKDMTTMEKIFYARGGVPENINKYASFACYLELPKGLARWSRETRLVQTSNVTKEFLILEIKEHEENLWFKIIFEGSDTILWFMP